LEIPVRPEALAADLMSLADANERALGQLALAQLEAEVALEHLERGLRRGEEERALCRSCPERAADAAREEEASGPALVEPRRRHRAAQLLQRPGGAVERLRQREDRLRVDRHLRLGALEAVLEHQFVVVEDDPVVDADHGTVADRMVVGLDPRVAL